MFWLGVALGVGIGWVLGAVWCYRMVMSIFDEYDEED